MRKALLLLVPLALAGCIKDTATHYIDGKDHALTLKVVQDYFWKDEGELTLVASRMPDCQRRFSLGAVPVSEVEVEVFSAGDNVYSLRRGEERWQVETQKCTMLQAPAEDALGEPVGVFRVEGKEMVFEAKSGGAAGGEAAEAAE